MASTKPPKRLPPRYWPGIHRPPGMKTRPFLRQLLKGDGLTVLTDALEANFYWAIVQRATSEPYALLCLTSRDRVGTMSYLIIPESQGFPEIPPRAFYAHILAHCPSPPSDTARIQRARSEKRYAELDAIPDYPIGTEFTLLGIRMRIIEPFGRRGCSALKIPGGGLFLLKREHLLSATIHPPQDDPPAGADPDDDKT